MRAPTNRARVYSTWPTWTAVDETSFFNPLPYFHFLSFPFSFSFLSLVLDRDGKIGDLEDKSESLLQGATQFNKSCQYQTLLYLCICLGFRKRRPEYTPEYIKEQSLAHSSLCIVLSLSCIYLHQCTAKRLKRQMWWQDKQWWVNSVVFSSPTLSLSATLDCDTDLRWKLNQVLPLFLTFFLLIWRNEGCVI